MSGNVDTKDALEALKKSPLFNLSLCSKEEFHSAFIVWFLNLNIKEHIKLFFEKPDFELDKEYEAITEYSIGDYCRLDIVIWEKEAKENDIRFVIENKFSDFPNPNQLKKYSNNEKIKNKNIRKCVLSFNQMPFSNDDWELVIYSDLVESMKCKVESEYEKSLITDYCLYVNSIYKLIEEKTEIKKEDNEKLFRFKKNFEINQKCFKIVEFLKLMKLKKIKSFDIYTSSPHGDRLTLFFMKEYENKDKIGLALQFYHSGNFDLLNIYKPKDFKDNNKNTDILKNLQLNNDIKNYPSQMKRKLKDEGQLYSLDKANRQYYIKQFGKNGDDSTFASEIINNINEPKKIAEILKKPLEQLSDFEII